MGLADSGALSHQLLQVIRCPGLVLCCERRKDWANWCQEWDGSVTDACYVGTGDGEF